jgi:hypothetical protein
VKAGQLRMSKIETDTGARSADVHEDAPERTVRSTHNSHGLRPASGHIGADGKLHGGHL